jgi:hypothetical protein
MDSQRQKKVHEIIDIMDKDKGKSSQPGEITPSYILHTRAFGTYLLGGGGVYLPCKKYKNFL